MATFGRGVLCFVSRGGRNYRREVLVIAMIPLYSILQPSVQRFFFLILPSMGVLCQSLVWFNVFVPPLVGQVLDSSVFLFESE